MCCDKIAKYLQNIWVYVQCSTHFFLLVRAHFLSLAQSKLILCSANNRPGYWSNLPCDWPSIAWAYSKQETENGPWSGITLVVLKLEYSCITRSIPWLLMLWLLSLPGHQQCGIQQDKWVPVFCEEGFQLPAPSNCWEVTEKRVILEG